MSAFNSSTVFIRGWYWALPAKDLAHQQIQTLDFLGKEIVLYRGNSGQVFAVDPYCPHMGAHFSRARIEGDSLRCGFHGWKFTSSGHCEEAPALFQKIQTDTVPQLRHHRVSESYGMIWIHTDKDSTEPAPHFPKFEGKKIHAVTDELEIRNCHPTLILGGGVDEDHFLFVHKKTSSATGSLKFVETKVSNRVVSYENIAKIPGHNLKSKFLAWLYSGRLTYKVTYWYATTALAELGPSWMPLYAIFAYRPLSGGRTIGLNIYLTPSSSLWGRLCVFMTKKILRRGGGEDTPIQNSISFKLGPWTKNCNSFSQFIEYVNEQPTGVWPRGPE